MKIIKTKLKKKKAIFNFGHYLLSRDKRQLHFVKNNKKKNFLVYH